MSTEERSLLKGLAIVGSLLIVLFVLKAAGDEKQASLSAALRPMVDALRPKMSPLDNDKWVSSDFALSRPYVFVNLGQQWVPVGVILPDHNELTAWYSRLKAADIRTVILLDSRKLDEKHYVSVPRGGGLAPRPVREHSGAPTRGPSMFTDEHWLHTLISTTLLCSRNTKKEPPPAHLTLSISTIFADGPTQ